MSNLRQAYAATQFANLDWSELSERPVDRVAAAGKASHLEIWKAAYSREPSSILRMHRIVFAAFVAKYPNIDEDLARRVVDQAIHEFLDPQCRVCKGAMQLVSPENINATVPCPACHASGLQEHSDEARSRRMQIKYSQAKHAAPKLLWLVQWLTAHDGAINVILNRELEREQPAIEH